MMSLLAQKRGSDPLAQSTDISRPARLTRFLGPPCAVWNKTRPGAFCALGFFVLTFLYGTWFREGPETRCEYGYWWRP